jgi:hypothetical protein
MMEETKGKTDNHRPEGTVIGAGDRGGEVSEVMPVVGPSKGKNGPNTSVLSL